MSGYIGNPDAESEHAMILAENGIHAARSQLVVGEVNKECDDCGDEIPEARRQFFIERGQQCLYCVECAPMHDKKPVIKMLDWVL